MEKGQKQAGQIEQHKDFDANVKEATYLAEKHDTFRTPEIQEKYDPMRHHVIQIKTSDYCIMFTVIKAKSKAGHSRAYPINYNQSNYSFRDEFMQTLSYFKYLIDKGVNLCNQ